MPSLRPLEAVLLVTTSPVRRGARRPALARASAPSKPSLIQSRAGSPGNLEVVARTRAALWSLWRGSGAFDTWSGP